jgi:hypothetical protein
MNRGFAPPEECPVCGADVPRGARACPGCGADERSGWNEEETLYDGLDLPGEADEGAESTRPGARGHLLRNLVIVAMIGIFLLFFVLR